MKYKVGDKVRVRSDLEVNKNYGSHAFVSVMEKFKSKIVTIERVDLNNKYQIKEDDGEWYWNDEMLLPVTFTKSDLETGHVVEYRDGQRRMVIGDTLIDCSGSRQITNFKSKYYSDNLTILSACNEWDICKVYTVRQDYCGSLYDLLDDADNLILIWEREEPPRKWPWRKSKRR